MWVTICCFVPGLFLFICLNYSIIPLCKLALICENSRLRLCGSSRCWCRRTREADTHAHVRQPTHGHLPREACQRGETVTAEVSLQVQTDGHITPASSSCSQIDRENNGSGSMWPYSFSICLSTDTPWSGRGTYCLTSTFSRHLGLLYMERACSRFPAPSCCVSCHWVDKWLVRRTLVAMLR